MHISKTILERRKQLGLTQAQLSKISEVSIPFIQLIERGQANPSLESTRSLLSQLGLKFEIQEQEPHWDDLSKIGVPIGTPDKHIRWNDTKSEALIRQAYVFVITHPQFSRERDALEAYLLAIRDHYPGKFRKFKNLERHLPKKYSGRIIKLRRIAIAYLAQIF